MEIYLETERMVLRRFTVDDAELLIGLDGDPDVMRYLNGGTAVDEDEIRDEVLPRMLACYETWPGAYGYWAALEKASGAFLGWFAFRPGKGSADDVPELGYRLHRAAWGKGYATEGSLALVRKGFAELGTRRVFAQTMAVNVGSRRVMEKVGLTYVRTFFEDWPDEIDGSDLGDVEYALDRDEWERNAAASDAENVT